MADTQTVPLYKVRIEVEDESGEHVITIGLRVACDDRAYLDQRIAEHLREMCVDNITFDSDEQRRAHFKCERGEPLTDAELASLTKEPPEGWPGG